tara:strand:+ start:994 stop:1155 length:162 start_codon:yes stop_codon:yes gene_type:complete
MLENFGHDELELGHIKELGCHKDHSKDGKDGKEGSDTGTGWAGCYHEKEFDLR